MILRRATAADCKQLYTLEQSRFTKENFALSRSSLYYHIKNSILIVAETDNAHIIGYVLALVKKRTPKLYSLAVARNNEGLGIATMLIRSMLHELERMHFAVVTLEVRSDNEAAIALYKKLGFIYTKTVASFYLDGCDALIMEKHFAG